MNLNSGCTSRAGRTLLRLVLLGCLVGLLVWIVRDLATRYFLDRGGRILRANLAREKDARPALEWLRLAEYTNPRNPMLHLYMGLYHTKSGDARAAESSFRQFGELAEKDLGYFFRIFYSSRERPPESAPATATAEVPPSAAILEPRRGGRGGTGFACVSVGTIVVSTSTRPPPLPGIDLEGNEVSPPTAVLFAWLGIHRMDTDLANRALDRAAPLAGRSFQYHLARSIWAYLAGERKRAADELERAFSLRDGDRSEEVLGVGVVPFSFWLERNDVEVMPQVGPWIGQLVTAPDATNVLTAELLASVAVMAQHRGEHKRSIQWAELARKRYPGELARLGLTDHVDRMVWPLPYTSLVGRSARKYRVDPLLVFALIREESHFNPVASSRVGARGLMQLMPRTAAWIAQMMKWGLYSDDLLSNPGDNIELGTYYLAYLKQALGAGPDALPWVLAAYNGGIGNVKRWLSLKETSSSPDLESIEFKETRDYIVKVTGAHKHYRRLYADRLAELDLPQEAAAATDAALAGADLPAETGPANGVTGPPRGPRRAPRKRR